MRKAIVILASILTVLMLSNLVLVEIDTAIAEVSGDYVYRIDGSNAIITAYSGPGGAIAIPSSLDGYPVTGIDSQALQGTTSLTSVTIPSSVANIGENAFSGCSSMTKLYFDGNAPSVGTDWILGHNSGLVIYINNGATGFTHPYWEGVPTFIQPLGQPGVPANLVAKPGDNQIELSWDPPTNDGGALIDYYVIHMQDHGSQDRITSDMSYTFTRLKNGDTYAFTVSAHNLAGLFSAETSQVQAVPQPLPGTPTNLVAVEGDRQVDLSWSGPDQGGSTVDYYSIYQGGNPLYTSLTTSYTVTDLVNGNTYAFTVAAHNAAGGGPQSSSVSATPRKAPDAPSGLQATGGNAQILLTWTAPNDNGAAIDHYSVYRDGTKIGETTITSFTDSGLTNGATYTYTVTAHNEAGDSDPSSSASTTPRAVPGAPTNFNAVPYRSRVNLSWGAPLDNGGSLIDYYVVYQNGTDISHVNGFLFSVTNLVNGVPYNFTVAAHSSIGDGLPAAWKIATPFTYPGTPINLQATPGDQQVSLNWTAPFDYGSPIIRYVVYQNGAVISHPTTTSFTIIKLTNGVNYVFAVAAENAAGYGGQATVSATPSKAPVVPGPPTSLNVTPGANQVLVSWSPPSNNGGAPISGYTLYWSKDNVTFNPIQVNETTYLHGELDDSVKYYYKVAAVNKVGEGNTSITISATTSILSKVPSVPLNFRAIVVNGSVQLVWDAPESDGGYPITSYMIYRSSYSIITSYLASTNGTHYLDDGLDGGTYYYTIVAVNKYGMGTFTNLAKVTVVDPNANNGSTGLPMEYVGIIVVVVVMAVLAVFWIRRRRQ